MLIVAHVKGKLAARLPLL